MTSNNPDNLSDTENFDNSETLNTSDIESSEFPIHEPRVNVTQQSRSSDTLPEQPLAQYLQQHIPDFIHENRFNIEQLSGGVSNLSYRLSSAEKSMILRRPPSGTKSKTAHNMAREYHLLKRLKDYYPLAPAAIHLDSLGDLLGEPFFLMQELHGLKVGKDLPYKTTAEQNAALCENWIDELVNLHKIDVSQGELSQLGKPQGFVERQLSGWLERFNQAKTPDVAAVDSLAKWLEQHLNKDSGFVSLIHNDYKFDNLLLNPADHTQISGVLDWELSTIGDPLIDLGCSLAYWVEAADSDLMQMIRRMPTQLEGMYSRAQIFDRYCEKRHLTGFNLTPYYVFGLFRLAGIGQQIYYRYYHQQTDNPAFKNFGQQVNILIKTAEAQIVS